MTTGPTLDALLPEEVARKADALGAAKARRDLLSLLTLSVLAGAFIALGAMFSTVVATGLQDSVPLGLAGGACLVALVYWLAYLRPRGRS